MSEIREGTPLVAAIDVDGTLSAYPVLAALSRALKAQGWTVYALTGFSQERGNITDEIVATHQANRERQLDSLGVARDRIQMVWGRNSLECSVQKAEFIAREGVSLFIDDADRYCTDVKRHNPSCCVLHVRENPRTV
jgi:hypothetical protein